MAGNWFRHGFFSPLTFFMWQSGLPIEWRPHLARSLTWRLDYKNSKVEDSRPSKASAWICHIVTFASFRWLKQGLPRLGWRILQKRTMGCVTHWASKVKSMTWGWAKNITDNSYFRKQSVSAAMEKLRMFK